MRILLLIELRKAIFNRWFLVALLIGLAVAISSATSAIIQNAEWSGMGLKYMSTKYYPLSLTSCYKYWIVNDFTQASTDLFFFLLPLLAVIPYGWSFAAEQNSGYFQQIVTRAKRINYFVAKGCAAFVSGGLVVALPIIINFVICACALPAYIPEVVELIYLGIMAESFWSEYFYAMPLLHAVLYTLMNFMFAGIWACAVCYFGALIKNRLAVMIIPFLFLIFLRYLNANVLNGIVFFVITPFDFLRGGGGDAYSGSVLAIYVLALFAFSFFVLFTRRSKDLI